MDGRSTTNTLYIQSINQSIYFNLHHSIVLYICNKLGDLEVGWDPNRPTTAIRFSKEHRHNPVMV